MNRAITWQDKPLKTPAGNPLAVPHAALAEAMQAEWDNNADKKMPPLSVLVASVIDVVTDKRPQITAAAVQYIDADVLCYFADNDAELADYQHHKWDEWLVWITDELQAAPQIAEGIRAVSQSEDYHSAAENILQAADDWHFYALQFFINACHSFILGYALYKNRLTAESAVELSEAETLYQEQSWGTDSEALQARRKLQDEIAEIQNYLLLLQD